MQISPTHIGRGSSFSTEMVNMEANTSRGFGTNTLNTITVKATYYFVKDEQITCSSKINSTSPYLDFWVDFNVSC